MPGVSRILLLFENRTRNVAYVVLGINFLLKFRFDYVIVIAAQHRDFNAISCVDICSGCSVLLFSVSASDYPKPDFFLFIKYILSSDQGFCS